MPRYANRELYAKVEPPKSPLDVPRYLREVLGGFFNRFFYIAKLVWESGKWIMFLLSFMAIFKGVTPVIGSLISKNVLNELQRVVKNGALPESDFWSSPICYLLIFLFVYRLMLRIINEINNALNRIAGETVVKQVRMHIMEKSKQLDMASYDNPEFYERMENANREAGTRPLGVVSETFGIVSRVIEFISYVVILMTAPGLAWATWVIIAVSVPSAVINFVYRKKTFLYMRSRSKERRQMSYYSGQLVNKGVAKEVRMYGLADLFIGRYLEVFREYYRGVRRLIVSESVWHVLLGIVSCLTNLTFYFLIARQVFIGGIMIGDYTLYTGAIATVSTCITSLINTSAHIYEGTLFIDNLIMFLNEPQTVAEPKNAPAHLERKVGHTLELRDVTFRYPGSERDVISHVSLTIRPGERVVLVGLNGAGKTTLIKLITRLYDPTEGEILLDGVNIKEYSLSELYGMFGIIFQDFGRYSVSVEENIRFGDLGKPHTEGDIQYAASQSAASEYIESLPDKYDTPLTRVFEPNGTELSGGQWQKLAIARAFYADSDFLILDEPTAALDPLAEQEIYNQFAKLGENKTTIFVSHRLSSATTADQIVVLKNGCLVENGTHSELMELRGDYYTLFSTQANRYVSPEAYEGGQRPRRRIMGQ
ncbi:MAG: ABC transporter ATP-binding protein [Clostridia bacterium]|nr:ABC transporter ATP-binding protein [Clostridia bacterium]